MLLLSQLPYCLKLGRVRSDEKLLFLPQEAFPKLSALVWQGQLTSAQQKLSQQLVQAVTGAGKTEMIYQAVDLVLKSGRAVGIASPRIDVYLELHQRLSRDFNLPITLLHDQSKAYFRSPLVICTTHQLLHFRLAFDLLIIDEVDVFPFQDNDVLYYAANHARKKLASLIYLTATSTPKLEQQVKTGQIRQLTLAQRFHGQSLSFLCQISVYRKEVLTK